ncbi:hemolysin-III related-domain-containing protein [Cokeromyces recurvatus]|uniref:hemolysin-III related-domain-containing protein n=1 Tax=Cokeromyces recurvatus TaxID=90255 RepID=UPI00222051E1|nr:hemolysin-III related-domain-containing protein [Cokeromyces recurvatus]KAI7902826.1 hemolysin-III related-domain-containing protein [Cokeromyces recurvatus]
MRSKTHKEHQMLNDMNASVSSSRSISTQSCKNRSRSQSIKETVSQKFKEMEHADTTGFIQYMDDQVHDTWDNAKAAMVGAQRLLQFHELPKEWQENEYILSGYRFYQSSQACLRSIFMLHNETINIWSHLIGFICMLCLSIYGFNIHFPDATLNDCIIFITFCAAALKCLFCSSIYHTFICHAHHQVKSFTATLDYMGISFLITASVLVTEYYGYYCRPIIRTRYMLFTAAIGAIGVLAPFLKRWDTKEFRPFRIVVFVSMAVSSALPVFHLVYLNGFMRTWYFFELAAISVAMYSLGVIVYANRFPEKFYPGKFDLAGLTSHAIWHMFVCLGIFFHYLASLRFYANRYSYGCNIRPRP